MMATGFVETDIVLLLTAELSDTIGGASTDSVGAIVVGAVVVCCCSGLLTEGLDAAPAV